MNASRLIRGAADLLVAAVTVSATSCGDDGDARPGLDPESATTTPVLTLGDDLAIRQLDTDEANVFVYGQYVVGMAELDEDKLRIAYCGDVTDDDIEQQLARLAEFARADRFRTLEYLQQDWATGRVTTQVGLGDLAGTVTVSIQQDGPRCIDLLSVPNERLAEYLVPGPPSE